MNLAANIDALLWFTTERGGARYYLYTFSPHTFHGRMYAYDPYENLSFCVSKYQIAEMSREAEYFVAGFLAGSEPSPPVGKDGPLPENDPKMVEWRTDIAQFHITGNWRPGRNQAV